MSTAILTESAAPRPRRSLLEIYLLEAKLEMLKMARIPGYIIPTITFPVLFYVLFGLGLSSKSFDMASYLVATYGAFGVIGTALFGFGVGVATERGQGWMLLKRATPMPPMAYFGAKLAMSVVFGAVIIVSLAVLGSAFGGVELTASRWLTLGGSLILGSIPFCAFGLALGFLLGPNSAPAIVNIIYLPAAVVSGLWIPIRVLPDLFQKIALVMPPYHLGQLALKSLGADDGRPVALHVGVLVLFGVTSLAVAVVAFRRDEGKTWG